MRSVLIALALASLAVVSGGMAQASNENLWTWSAQLSVSVVLKDSDWSISHPIVGDGGVTWESFRGTFNQSVLVQMGVELQRGHFGVRGTVGLLPQEFTQVTPTQGETLSLVLGGLSGVYYPRAKSPGRLQPYAAVGVGGQKATGGIENSGFYVSGTAGVKLALDSWVAVDAGLQLHRLKYTQLALDSNIAKDVAIYPISLLLGTRIAW